MYYMCAVWRAFRYPVCTACPLASRTVNAQQSNPTDLMFVGEAHRQGRTWREDPLWSGGQLLDRILEAIDLTRDDIIYPNIKSPPE